MSIYCTDPLQDRRWAELVETHPRASVFHTPSWLEALQRTYRYQPILFTTSPANEPLGNGIVFCGIKSFLTGSRLVSLPFADHCEPLVNGAYELGEILSQLIHSRDLPKYKYIELRTSNCDAEEIEARSGLSNSAAYAFHELDLRPDLNSIFRSLHPSCVQRKIQRAEREGVKLEEGISEEILQHFYSLMIQTRRRHRLPPQPISWFRNLRDSFGRALKIRVASRKGQAIASILTLQHKNSIVYKYGCSDAHFHKLGGMPFLFWKVIEEGKKLGVRTLDLGRSDLDDHGLITFKEHLAATASTLHYYRFPAQFAKPGAFGRRASMPKVLSYLPDSLLKAAGRLLYRHVG